LGFGLKGDLKIESYNKNLLVKLLIDWYKTGSFSGKQVTELGMYFPSKDIFKFLNNYLKFIPKSNVILVTHKNGYLLALFQSEEQASK
jgi:hypothetical protein